MERKLQAGFLMLVGLANIGIAHAQTAVTTDTVSQQAKTNIETSLQFGQTYGPIHNETLWSISKRLVKNTKYSIHQGVNAISIKNPQAFRNGNIIKNAVLKLPTLEEMALQVSANQQYANASSNTSNVHLAYSTDLEPLPGSSSVSAQPEQKESAQNVMQTTVDESTNEQTAVAQTTTTSDDVPMLSEPVASENSYQALMNTVIAQNGGFSNDPLFACNAEDKFCFSGLLDLDGRYYDHHGNPGFGYEGPLEQSSLGGVGVRPPFGPSYRTVVGSINNANAFIDLRLPPYAKIHSNFAYVNGSVLTNSYILQFGADWGSAYRVPASLKVDELYLVLANADLLPIYFKVGRMYADFGDYIPNGYGIQTITPSLTQLMTQSRTGAGQLGFVHPSGAYGSFTMSYAQASFAADNRPADLISHTSIGPNKRNFSGKLGFRHTFSEVLANLNVSYMADLRDVDYLNDTYWWIDSFVNIWDSILYTHSSNKQGGLAYHADFYLCPFGLSFEGMYSTGKMNPGIDTTNSVWDSHIRTGGVEGWIDFKVFQKASSLRLAYQWARHTQVVGGSIFGGRPSFHNMLPKYRWQGTYTINVFQHINLGLQWVHDHDFDEGHNGADQSSNLAVVRLDAEF